MRVSEGQTGFQQPSGSTRAVVIQPRRCICTSYGPQCACALSCKLSGLHGAAKSPNQGKLPEKQWLTVEVGCLLVLLSMTVIWPYTPPFSAVTKAAQLPARPTTDPTQVLTAKSVTFRVDAGLMEPVELPGHFLATTLMPGRARDRRLEAALLPDSRSVLMDTVFTAGAEPAVGKQTKNEYVLHMGQT